ncbi:MAG: hypothetical protein KBS59_01715 [Clostridiales bacterium]|nr:hypothetical protein [Clostridiales bacterium]
MDKTVRALDSGFTLYYAENKKCASFANDIKTKDDLLSRGFESVKASVPGNFVLDLFAAGKIPDPELYDNAIKLQYLEAMHVWYLAEFDEDFSEKSYLRFDGLDTVADVYLDGEHILRAENMFIPHKAKVKPSRGHHTLIVHFTPAVIEGRKYTAPASSNALWYNYQGLYIRKAAHSYGWDILPRIISCGIWKPVYIMEEKADSINDVFAYTLFTKPDENKAKLRIYFDISVSGDLVQEYRIRFSGKCGDSSFCEEITPWGTEYSRMAFTIDGAKLWWPRGYGDANIYECRAELTRDGKVLDTYPLCVGLRTVKLTRSESVRDGNGQFLFEINGTPVFFRGVNWVPLSPYASENEKRLTMYLDLLKDSGSNAVRMWGGGIYESDTFFDFCNKNGIMVWQDFMMACAVYPQDETFEKKLEPEVVYEIKRLRNNPSLVLWSGDNECDCTYNTWGGVIRDPNENTITRKLLPDLVRIHDFSRPYLPSSPYISRECFENNLKSPEEHLWGDRPYYKSDYYTKSECFFVSEIGYPGAVSPESAAKFIGSDELYPILDENGKTKRHWLAHATETMITDDESPYKYRTPLYVGKVADAFGALPDSYSEFAALSQIVQAEAVKYFIELFRGEKWRRTGIIYWNLADGWPISSEAVADCYGTKKLAFSYMARAYEPVYLMIKENGAEHVILASNDTLTDKDITFKVSNAESGEIIAAGTICAKANDVTDLGKIRTDGHTVYLIEWTCGGKEYKSHYIESIRGFDAEKYIDALKKHGLFELYGF